MRKMSNGSLAMLAGLSLVALSVAERGEGAMRTPPAGQARHSGPGAVQPAPASGPRVSSAIVGDGGPPSCVVLESSSPTQIVAVARDESSIQSIELAPASVNVELSVAGSIGSPEVHFNVDLGESSSSGQGLVIVEDSADSTNTCTLAADFRDVPAGPLSDFEICSGDGVSLVISNPNSTPPGTSSCGINVYSEEEPDLPPGYEPYPFVIPTPDPTFSPAFGSPNQSQVLTIASPVEGETQMTLTIDVPFDPRLRLLLASFDEESAFGPTSPVFRDVTQTVRSSGDDTILIGSGRWSLVKVTFAWQAEICNAVDDDGDGQVDEGIDDPGLDADNDSFTICADDPAQADCNDDLTFIHPGANELCNGLDDDCDGDIEDPAFDADSDGFPACPQNPADTDCNDEAVSIHPGASEICNSVDDDCDGVVDDNCVAPQDFVSLLTNQFVPGAGTRRQQDVLALPGTLTPIDLFGDSFLPNAVGLDAVDVLSGGDFLFSVRTTGGVHHTGGFTVLRQDDVYRFDPATGEITQVLDWGAHGLDIGTLDALDRLADGSFAFSTETVRGVTHAGGYLVLRPENVYRFDPATQTLELLFDGRSLGLPDLDGVDVLRTAGAGGLRIAFSTATNRLIFTPQGPVFVQHQNVYLYDAADGSLTLVLNGGALGLLSLDAFTLGAGIEP